MHYMHDEIRKAFRAGFLEVRSVAPDGTVCWCRVQHVHRHQVDGERIHELTLEDGSKAVLTGGHRVYLNPVEKVETEQLTPGVSVQCVRDGRRLSVRVVANKQLEPRTHMYDLTAEHWHNFSLKNTGLSISNSPDRNYHFRPPTHEETVQQYNRVFGFVWEDEELVEYLINSLNMVSLSPPAVGFGSLDDMCTRAPAWSTVVLTGAAIYALQALMINWAQDEFSYSIGGISLDLEKSSKFDSIRSAFQSQFDAQLEKAKATVNVIRGLQQPRYGVGIRSAFGPYVGRGVLSPRKFLGL